MASLVLGAAGAYLGGAAATAMGFAAGTFGAALFTAAGSYAGPAIGNSFDPAPRSGLDIGSSDAKDR